MWRTEDFVEITANIVINFIIIIFLVSKASPIPRTRKKWLENVNATIIIIIIQL